MIITTKKAIEIIKKGGVVAFPTETVYGLGADATNQTAIKKIYQAKGRPADNPLICHFHNIEQVAAYTQKIPKTAAILMDYFWPGPCSFMLTLPSGSPLYTATCGRSEVICRIPANAIAREIIEGVDRPIAAPSANISGRMSATTADMVTADFGERIDGVVDGGPCGVGIESTILDVRRDDTITILRPGPIGKKELLSVLNEQYERTAIDYTVVVNELPSNDQVVPGAKYKHYAPRTPLLASTQPTPKQLADAAAVFIGTTERWEEIKKMNTANPSAHFISLGSRLAPEQISRRLYRSLFELDTLQPKQGYFLTESWGDESVVRALNNRLKKILGQ